MTPRHYYGLIGYPVSHSLSPQIWQAFACQFGMQLDYHLWPVPPNQFDRAFSRLVSSGMLRGFNVTAPLKQQACARVTHLSPRAERAGAVNMVRVLPDGTTFGDNTDGVGLIKDLTGRLHFSLVSKRIALMGAGGAARGILPALLDRDPAAIVLYNRSQEKAYGLAKEFPEKVAVGVKGILAPPFDLVINAGFAGTENALPDMRLVPGALAYDLVYGRGETFFMQWAKRQGAASVSDGLGLLVEQAAASFRILEGLQPEAAPVLSQLMSG